MNTQAVRDELLLIMDQCAAAEREIVEAYYRKRTPQRDEHWVKLQCGKELTAAMAIKVEGIMSLYPRLERAVDRERFRAEFREAWEEMNHYCGYVGVLEYLLEDSPVPIEEIRRYSVRAPDRQWPAHSRRVLGVELMRELASDWRRSVLLASGEGGAAAFHWAVSQLPPDDEFLRRVAAVARMVRDDEIHHGPQEIHRLSQKVPSVEEFELVKQEIIEVQRLTILERNEQFIEVLSGSDLDDLQQRLITRQIEPVKLFRALV